jgi:Flp pilus assembly protein TadG
MITFLKKYRRDEKGAAAVEAALIMPVLLFMYMGIVDLGNALVVNKKAVSAAQIASDLLARQETVDDADIEDAMVAARLALQPYETSSFGIDIAGIRFDTPAAVPTLIWRETFNMTPNDEVIAETNGLGLENEGVIAVTVRYVYDPVFMYILDEFWETNEVAIVRGRKKAFVMKE